MYKKQSRNHRINGGKNYNAKKFPPSVKGLAEALKVENKKNIRDIKKKKKSNNFQNRTKSIKLQTKNLQKPNSQIN